MVGMALFGERKLREGSPFFKEQNFVLTGAMNESGHRAWRSCKMEAHMTYHVRLIGTAIFGIGLAMSAGLSAASAQNAP